MSDAKRAAFKDVVRHGETVPTLPIDAYLAELDRLIADHNAFRQDEVIPAIGKGTASREVVCRLALEYYYLGKWMTPEFALLIANAPDAYSLSLEHSEHYAHWCQNFADETGYLRDPNHVLMKWEWCQMMGISAEELEAYAPLPETISVTFTMLYYVR